MLAVMCGVIANAQLFYANEKDFTKNQISEYNYVMGASRRWDHWSISWWTSN